MVKEVDVALLVGSTAYLADAAAGVSPDSDQVQVATAGKEMPGAPFQVPSGNTRLPFVDPSRPADPENRTFLDPRGPIRPQRVLWTGRRLHLRGSAVHMQETLSSLKYTADLTLACPLRHMARLGPEVDGMPSRCP